MSGLSIAEAKSLKIGDPVVDADLGTKGTVVGLLDDDGLVQVKFGDCFPMGLWPRQIFRPTPSGEGA